MQNLMRLKISSSIFQEKLLTRMLKVWRLERTFHGGSWLKYEYHWTLLLILTNTSLSLPTRMAVCSAVSPASSFLVTSAPHSRSLSTILNCFERMAVCRGVFPDLSPLLIADKKNYIFDWWLDNPKRKQFITNLKRTSAVDYLICPSNESKWPQQDERKKDSMGGGKKVPSHEMKKNSRVI